VAVLASFPSAKWRIGDKMAKNDRTVSQRPDGKWADKRDGAERAAKLHPTQKEAAQGSKEHLKNQGGGELKIKGVDGKIRSKDTIGRPDPFPPEG
jgi:hypothetical protein